MASVKITKKDIKPTQRANKTTQPKTSSLPSEYTGKVYDFGLISKFYNDNAKNVKNEKSNINVDLIINWVLVIDIALLSICISLIAFQWLIYLGLINLGIETVQTNELYTFNTLRSFLCYN